MTVPEALEVAKKHFVTVLPEYGNADLRLEELETPPFGSKWSFTFSAVLPGTGNQAAVSLTDVLRGRRVSKSVQIDPESGELLSVKNAAA